MKANLIAIGNSRGIRIPKAILDQVGFTDEAELDVRDGQIIIRPAGRPRTGWDAAFQAMAERGDDALLDPMEGPSRWDEKEWTW
jgi:antitoxin MazE